jgi:hypothetical protein
MSKLQAVVDISGWMAIGTVAAYFVLAYESPSGGEHVFSPLRRALRTLWTRATRPPPIGSQ